MGVTNGASPTEINFVDSDLDMANGRLGVAMSAGSAYPDPNNTSAKVRDLKLFGKIPTLSKGGLWTFDGSGLVALPVGADGTFLKANSSVSKGVEWAAVSGGSGGGGLTLLEQHAASGSAELDFPASISSSYDRYQLELCDLVPATDGSSIIFQVSTDGGSTWETSSIYNYEIRIYSSGYNSIIHSSSDTSIRLSGGISATASHGGFNAVIRMCDPLSTSHNKILIELQGFESLAPSTGYNYMYQGGGTYLNTSAYNAFRLLFNSGNIASGTVRCYGLAKT